jgi:DNA-binding transcriptional regulator YiaG
MTPDEYRKQKDKEFRATRRAKGEKMILAALEHRKKMEPYTSPAIAKRHKVSTDSVRNMRNGRDPRNLTEQKKAAIRKDIAISEKLAAEYVSWEDIGEELNVSRGLVRQWAKELGVTSPNKAMVRKIKAPKPKPEIVIEGKEVEFLTMPTVVSQPAQGWYY